MGIYSSADLLWGLPVLAYDEDTGDSTRWWSDENEDWREFDGLVIQSYGHYEDDQHRAVVTVPYGPSCERADCWEPKRLELPKPNVIDSANSDLKLALSRHGFQHHEREFGYWLVASVG